MTEARDDVRAMLRRLLAAEGEIEEVSTHASELLIGARRVFKLKKPLRYGYLDYSTPQKRLAAIEAEYRLNRRTAPGLYLGFHRITRTSAGLALDVDGDLVDAVLEMKRFPDDCLLDHIAARGNLSRNLLDRLARSVAAMHASAQIHREHTTERIERVLAINEAAFAETQLLSRQPNLQSLLAECRAAYEQQQPRLLRRAVEGRVRRCHGDLTLRNICVLEGVPTPFDCLEFSDDLATTDVLYDLAFVLMDLWHRGLKPEANWLMNRYLDQTGDENDIAVLPLFMAMRACVRSHVAAARAAGESTSDAWLEALAYATTAKGLLQAAKPRFLAIGGFSGSGKSTVAAALAHRLGAAPGARVLSSDRVRKALFGVAPEVKLQPHAYAPVVSQRVYDDLFLRAARLLQAGGSVVLDAVFDRAVDRLEVEALGKRVGLPICGVWLNAPEEVQEARINARQGDASDATAEVLHRQRRQAESTPEWRRIEASRPLDCIVTEIVAFSAT